MPENTNLSNLLTMSFGTCTLYFIPRLGGTLGPGHIELLPVACISLLALYINKTA